MDHTSSTRTSYTAHVRITLQNLSLIIFLFHKNFVYSFSKFRLEGSSYSLWETSTSEEICPYDGVYIFDESSINNSTPQYLGQFCGILDDRLPEVKSTTNVMYVQFLTDGAGSEEGFVGEVSFVYGKYLFYILNIAN